MATDSIIVPSDGAHDKTIIWLHGFTLNAADMQQRIQELDWYSTPGIKNIFLNAPSIYVDWASISPYAPFPSGTYTSWFNYDASFPRTNDTSGIQASVQTVINTINSEIAAGIDPKNIILGGFSQGASIALLSAMEYDGQLGGVLAFDTFIGNLEDVVYTTTPVFLTYGINDSIVSANFAEDTRDHIGLDGIKMSWNTYVADHVINDSMLNDADLFLNSQYGLLDGLKNKMKGALHDQTYYIDNIGDKITESATGGIDTAIITLESGYSGKFSNIELIYGSNGNDTITLGTTTDGVMSFGAGEDRLILAKGDNNFYVANVENIIGNTGNDTIFTLASNTSNMTVNGGLGNDIFTGGNKSNTYVFSTKLNTNTNVDTITNFSSADDTIHLSKKMFKALGTTVTSDEIVMSTDTLSNHAYIIYDASTKTLSYDADGSGTKSVAIAFAVLTGVDTVSASDFQII